jgi:ABC-type glycerol-3-phosphate transport system substrate-binding protein
MKRIALALGAALLLLGAAVAFLLFDDKDTASPADGATTVTSTTYTIWSVDPPAPLDGSDLPSR